MKPCTNPAGHTWRATSFRIAAGSTPVECEEEGCRETGYYIDNQVLDRDGGLPGEELF